MNSAQKMVAAFVGGVALIAAVTAAERPSRHLLARMLVNRLEAQSGLHADIGSASLGFSPGAHITANDLKLSARNGAPQAPIFSAQQASFGLSVAALFSGNVRLTDVTLDGPVLRIDQPPPSVSRDTTTRFGSFHFDGPLTVKDGLLIYRNPLRKIETQVEAIALTASPTATGKLDVTFSGRLGGLALRLNGMTSSAATLATGHKASFDGEIAAGAADVPAAKVHAQLQFVDSTLGFDNMTIVASGSQLNAAGSIRLDGDAPKISAHLYADRFDAGSVIDTVLQDDADDATGFGGLSDRHIDFSQLRLIDATIEGRTADMHLGSFDAGKATTNLTLNDGLAHVSFAAPRFGHGNASALVTIDATQSHPTESLHAKVSDMRTAGLMQAIAGFGEIDGNLQAALDVKSTGSSVRSIAQNLAGIATIRLADATIAGIDLPGLRSIASYLPGVWHNIGSKIPLKALTGNFTIADGKAVTDDVLILSPILDVTGKGSIDLAAQSLDLRFDPKFATAPDQAQKTSPADLGAAILVRGPWANPRVSADLGGVLKNPQGVLGTLQDLGQSLLGGGAGAGSDDSRQDGDQLMKGLGDTLRGFSGSQNTRPQVPSDPSQ